MESGILPAIISFFLPGLGQALTDGKPTAKWIGVFIIILIIEWLITYFSGLPYIWVIFGIIFAYDAYANLITI